MDDWKNSKTPWDSVVDMGNLTNLIYDYAKNWKINELDGLSEFFEKEDGNTSLCSKDKTVLLSLKERYPEGKILKFFTNSADLQCVIGENPHKKRYTLVFRGSESVWDWLYDLMVLKTTLFDNVSVHSGFHKQLMNNNTYHKIGTFMQKLIDKNPDWSWYVSGHSLGGALATLAGFLYARHFYNQRFTVISLASPRVGNSHFRDCFNNQKNLRHFRVCNYRDCVTAMPMFWYCHVGRNLYFDTKKNTWFDYGFNAPFSYYFYNCWNPYDHSCSLYIKCLQHKQNQLLEAAKLLERARDRSTAPELSNNTNNNGENKDNVKSYNIRLIEDEDGIRKETASI